MTTNVGLGLPLEWKAHLIGWAKGNLSARELWLFGNRAKGVARIDNEVDLGLVLMPPVRRHHWAFENYIALHTVWQVELESIVQCHVNLVPMIPNDLGNEIIRSTGICLWERLTGLNNRPKLKLHREAGRIQESIAISQGADS